MAHTLCDDDCVTHLRGTTGTLCGVVVFSDEVRDAVMTCKACATLVLNAIELTTKAERREWRKL